MKSSYWPCFRLPIPAATLSVLTFIAPGLLLAEDPQEPIKLSPEEILQREGWPIIENMLQPFPDPTQPTPTPANLEDPLYPPCG